MRALLAGLLLCAAAPAMAAEGLVHDVWAGGRSTTERAVPQTALLLSDEGLWGVDGLLMPRARRSYLSAFAGLSLDAPLSTTWSALLLLDTGDLRSGASLDPPLDADVTSEGRSIGEAVTSGAMLRELALLYRTRGGEIMLGRRRYRLADGLVYDDFGTGLVASLEGELGERDVRAELAVLAVGRTFAELERPSPLLALRLEVLPSIFESVSLFGAVFVDRAGTLADVFRSIGAERVAAARLSTEPGLVQLAPVCVANALPAAECRRQLLLTGLFLTERPSRGWTSYGGAEVSLLPFDGVSVRGAAVAGFGEAEVTGTTRTLRLELRGWAAQTKVSYALGEAFGLGALAFGLSGASPFDVLTGESERYGAFVGVAPYWTWTGLFFSGGVAQGFYAGRAASAGVNGHGVAGGGLWLEYAVDALVAEAKVVYLSALARAPGAPLGGGGASYGTETDLRVDGFIGEHLSISAELDVLWPGDFFPRREVALRGVLQVVVHHD